MKTHVDLFSGIGACALAAEWAGFKTVQLCEIDSYCQKVLNKNFEGVPIHDDITTFDGTRHRGATLVTAGVPCQPASVAGKRQGVCDDRWLWPYFPKAVRDIEPEWFMAENPTGLLTLDGGRAFGGIVSDLAQIGYRVGWIVYGAADVGAWHLRRAIIYFAHQAEFKKFAVKSICTVH